MATIQAYNHTQKLFASGANAASDTYKVILLSSSATFNATHTTLAQVTNSGAYEVSGHGWTSGGVEATNAQYSTVNTNGAKFRVDDIAVSISGGTLGPFSAYVIANVTDLNSPPLFFVTLTAPKSYATGNTARIEWPAEGLVLWSEAT